MTKKKAVDGDALEPTGEGPVEESGEVTVHTKAKPEPPPELPPSESVSQAIGVPNQDMAKAAEQNHVLPGDNIAEIHRKANNQAEVDRFLAEKPSANTKLGDDLRAINTRKVKEEILKGLHGEYVVGQSGEPRVTR